MSELKAIERRFAGFAHQEHRSGLREQRVLNTDKKVIPFQPFAPADPLPPMIVEQRREMEQS